MKGFTIVAIVGLVAVGMMFMSSTNNSSALKNQFSGFIAEYKKSYSSQAEYEMRMKIFAENMKQIEEHNASGSSYTMGMNKFGDWTHEEFKQLLGYRPTGSEAERQDVKFDGILGASVDWEAKGAVNKVQNQGSCGSCWAFGTIGAVEGAYFTAHNKLYKFAEQELVDCCHDQCYGCNGGFQNNALNWLEHHAICLESEYKYTARDGTCHESSCKALDHKPVVKSYVEMKRTPEALTAALNIVPVSVTVDASKWQFYSSGIYDNSSCYRQLNHAVLGTGYGAEGTNAYYRIKNSWGTSWGERGFIRIKQTPNGSGICGIYEDNSYAVAN